MTVRSETLASGLRVVTHRIDTVETVSLGVWIHVGTRFEPAAVNGVSHLLEHMAFKGTARRSARDIAEEIEAVGGHLNAFTSREVTAYHATVLKADIALAVDLVADIVQHSTFDPGELERERAVVLQEIGQCHDTPEDIVFDLFQETAYPDQAMGRSVLGPPEIVAALPREALVDYMTRHYTAPRTVFAAAGRLDHDSVVRQAAEAFADLGSGAAPAPAPARYGGGERREQRALEQVHLVLGFEGVGYHDPDYYAASVASMLLGGGMSSRLFQEIREKRALAYSIYSFTSAYTDSGLFGVYAGTGEDGIAELVPVLCGEIAAAAAGIGADELARARAQLVAGVVMSLESTAARAEQIARQVLVYGRPLPLEEVVAKIEAVDAAAVERVVARMLQRPPAVAAIGPLGRMQPFADIAARLAPAA